MLNELFTNESKEVTASARQLNGTAELTRISEKIAIEVINSMEADIENYRDRLQQSTNDMRELDKLINELADLQSVDTDFLLEIDEDTIDGMLKSQQSKRSRCKSKAMTLDNYRAMMTAAIAEDLIRIAWNKPKSAHGPGKRAGSIDYTPEELEALAADQEALKKEIRNVQSKKSIMKSKADFSEDSERWQQLLKVEQMLKDLRVGGGRTEVVEVDTTKDALADLLSDVDIENIDETDCKELLATIAGMIDA